MVKQNNKIVTVEDLINELKKFDPKQKIMGYTYIDRRPLDPHDTDLSEWVTSPIDYISYTTHRTKTRTKTTEERVLCINIEPRYSSYD